MSIFYKGKGNIYEIENESNIDILITFEEKKFILGLNKENENKNHTTLNFKEIKNIEFLNKKSLGTYKEIIIYRDEINNRYIVTADDQNILQFGHYNYGINNNLVHSYIIMHKNSFILLKREE